MKVAKPMLKIARCFAKKIIEEKAENDLISFG